MTPADKLAAVVAKWEHETYETNVFVAGVFSHVEKVHRTDCHLCLIEPILAELQQAQGREPEPVKLISQSQDERPLIDDMNLITQVTPDVAVYPLSAPTPEETK